MATIAQSQVSTATAAVALTRTVMTASDTFTYVPGAGQKLILWNTTAALVTITIDGTGGTVVSVPRAYGLAGSVDVSAGKTVGVAASSTYILNCDDYGAYFAGTVTITGGTGLTAHLTDA